MKSLYKLLLKLYLTEVNELSMGYDFDKKKLCAINDLIQTIDYLENGNPSSTEFFKIVQYYDQTI